MLRVKTLLVIVMLCLLVQPFSSFGSIALPMKLDLSVAGAADQITYNADAGDTRSSQQLWQSVATGDVNGDGVKDILVSAPYAQGADNRRQLSGEVLVFFGRVDGSNMTAIRDAAMPSPPRGAGADVIIYGPARSSFGYSIASADVNGDQIDDIVVGAFTATKPAIGGGQQAVLAGAAFVVFGSNRLTSGTRVDLNQSDGNRANVRIYGAHTTSLAGYAVAAGDVNGDGIGDVIVGAPGANKAGMAQAYGAAYILFGGSSLGGVIDLAAMPGSASGPSAVVFGADASGRTIGDQLGVALAMGDVNGDGNQDLIVSSPLADGAGNQRRDAGEVYLIPGSSSLAAGTVLDLAMSQPAVTISGAEADDQIGLSLASGDVNGDGVGDVIIGAPMKDGDAGDDMGVAYVVFGARNLMAASTRDLNQMPGGFDLLMMGSARRSTLGQSVASGDLNGDQIADLIVAADGAANERNMTSGVAYVIFGRRDFMSGTVFSTSAPQQGPGPDVTILGVDNDDRLGFALAAGDVNGDMIADLLIAAPGGDGPTNNRSGSGETYVVFGEQ
jgi:hypothetical protein